MKPTFTLPKTKLSTVVWYRGGAKYETLLDTPRSNAELFHTMLGRKVGFSEIRAVKAVDGDNLADLIGRQSLRRR